ncbi:lysine 5,6-aminomutase reactivase subunit KamB [Aromatoleum toluclasticum]|uniref:lysine 5,6-aminomutase reactivase subunit KamB n=1 Tax=Aromatoleum toluclasticum TaxID=92003 RepID=UPI00037E92D2|nr:hypothetical protein [Aromatoleum toluclasticum]
MSEAAAMTGSALWREIRAAGMTTLAVMGMTKNTGKTVCLNHLLAQAHAHGTTVGITSIGRDGEDRDQVFSIPKPPVLVWPGSLVATARDTLLRAKVRWKQIGTTGIDSPMGEILIVRALDHGEMEIAGASRSSDQQKVIGILKGCGCALVLLDGALGRSHHASPAIADGVVLATGAAIGGGIPDVIRKTRDRLAILGIPAVDEVLVARCEHVFAHGGIGVWNGAGEVVFDARIPTLNAAPTLLGLHDPATIAVSGAVGRALWHALKTLAARHPGLTVVVADGTKLFVDANDVAGFTAMGAHLAAFRRIRIAGITVNPFSPLGGSFDAGDFLDAARRAFPDHVVADVMREEQTEGVLE